MANLFKKVIDRHAWVQVPASPNAHAAGGGLASDLRSDVSRNPFVYQLVSTAAVNRFNIVSKSWSFVYNPGLATSGVAAGSSIAFVPSFGLVGTIAAGATTTRVTLSTALPTAVGVNMLANRGGSGEYGFKLRIIDTTAGKTAERYIVANTGGTTPAIDVQSSFGFTPATGARYEIVAGRVYTLQAGAVTATTWRSFEVASNTLASLTNTGLPTIATDSDILVLDEQYTPYDNNPGDGMIKGTYNYDTGLVARYALTATGSGASSLTGQASGGDASVVANEYRNFQIRIVEDTGTPTAVGQRRVIASHTAGASPVYTLGTAWGVTPSTSAKFVIELPNLMLVRTAGNTTTYTYNYMDATINNGTNSITSGAWSTTYFGAGPGNNALGCMWMPSWGIQPDVARNSRHSFCYFFRGASANLDLLDIAGSITGTWTGAIVYDGSPGTFPTTGSCGTYAPYENEGRMFYCNLYVASAVNQMYRFDVQNRVLVPFVGTDQIQAGTAATGKRMASYCAIDDDQNYDVILLMNHLSTICQELIPLV